MPRGGPWRTFPILAFGFLEVEYLFACGVTVVKGRVNICLNTRNNCKKVKKKIRTVKFDLMELRF